MRRLAFAAGILVVPLTALAQGFVMKEPEIRFTIEVYGPASRDANPSEWPATFVYRTAAGDQCSSTAIGERVLLTAAHCLAANAIGTIEIGLIKRDVSCQRHPAYPANGTADFSLCLVTPPLAAPKRGFETLSTQASAPAVGAEIKLLGFGCRVAGGPDRGFGVLAEGDATVVEVQADYVVTGGGAGVCFGDSGGGAYVSPDDYQRSRRLVAVNSRADSDYSWLSLVGSPLFMTWANQWSSNQKAPICGLGSAARNCRP